MNKELIKKEALIIFILLLPNIYFLFIYNELPDQLPIHWNLQGEADNFGHKNTLSFIHIGIYLLLIILPLIDPRKSNYKIFEKSYYRLRLAIILFMGAFNTMVFLSETGHDINLTRVIIVGILLLFMVLGNYMNNLRPNWFIGIRTPWTLDNEEVWRKTHHLASRLFFGFGFIALILSFFLADQILLPLMFWVLISAAIIPAIYSYILYRRFK